MSSQSSFDNENFIPYVGFSMQGWSRFSRADYTFSDFKWAQTCEENGWLGSDVTRFRGALDAGSRYVPPPDPSKTCVGKTTCPSSSSPVHS